MKYDKVKGLNLNYIKKLIALWNNDRLPMFVISNPDDNGIFYGVIRLFYYDSTNTIQSKCIRISSRNTCIDVLRIFLDKIQANGNICYYSLFATHFNGDYTLLDNNDMVLLVQLAWADEGIEGRFMIKLNSNSSHAKKIKWNIMNIKASKAKTLNKLSSSNESISSSKESIDRQIRDLFKSVPDGPLVSSIANHDAALSRKRQQKLTTKIQEFMQYEEQYGDRDDFCCPDGKPKLGTLKIFATSIFPETPYKTIIVSIYDNVRCVIKEALEKFHTIRSDIDESLCYLSMVTTPRNQDKKKGKHLKVLQREYCILDDDRPLLLQYRYSSENELITFHLRRKVNLENNRLSTISQEAKSAISTQRYFAILCELSVYSTVKPSDHPTYISFLRDIVVIGSNHFSVKEATFLGHKPSQVYVLKHHAIHPLHCILSSINGVLSITPSVMDADVCVDGDRIYETTALMHGNRVSIGCVYCFEVHIPTKTTTTMSTSYWQKDIELKNKENNFRKNQSLISKALDESKNKKIYLPIEIRFKPSSFEVIFAKIAHLLQTETFQFKLSLSFIMYITVIGQFDNRFNIKNSEESLQQENMTQSCKKFQDDCEVILKILDDEMIYYTQGLPHLFLWLGNISEFSNFLRNDKFIAGCTESLQNFCDQCTRIILNEINQRFENDLKRLIEAFFAPISESQDIPEELDYIMCHDPSASNDIYDENDENICIYQNETASASKLTHFEQLLIENRIPRLCDIIICLNEWLSLFCKFCVNPSYTVQTFTRLFTFTCKILIDYILSPPIHIIQGISSNLGNALKIRFNILRLWAESQGLEMIFDKYFQPLIKVLDFITCSKRSYDQFKTELSKCDILNSTQIHKLLSNWKNNEDFRYLLSEWIILLTEYAKENHDPINEKIGNTKLPFSIRYNQTCFITKDGYFSENLINASHIIYNIIKSLPITEDIEVIKSHSNTSKWNLRFLSYNNPEVVEDIKAEYQFITLIKNDDYPLGMKIVSIKNSSTKNTGIFISYINPNSFVDKDNRLHIGDQLVTINGRSLIGIDENKAANIIFECGSNLKFEVLKNSALLHGIEIPTIAPKNTQPINTLNSPVTNGHPSIPVTNIPRPITFPSSLKITKNQKKKIKDRKIANSNIHNEYCVDKNNDDIFIPDDTEMKSIPQILSPHKNKNQVQFESESDEAFYKQFVNNPEFTNTRISRNEDIYPDNYISPKRYNETLVKSNISPNKVPNKLLLGLKHQTEKYNDFQIDENINEMDTPPPRPPPPIEYSTRTPCLKKEYC